MKTNKKEMAILYIKKQEMKCASISQQTKNLRDKTNEKIRNLGKKYYIIKALLEKYNFKRDDIFHIAKELENEYKNIKRNIHIQNQLRRMKEALYCWYAENFFDELSQPNSALLCYMLMKKNNFSVFNVKIKTHTKCKEQEKTPPNKIKAKYTNETHIPESSQKLKINQEIDSFDFSNINNGNINDTEEISHQENDNFNFDKFLNF